MDWGTQTVSLFLCLAILLTTIRHGNAERKVVCYYTNWSIYRPGTAKFSPQNINPYLCTHLIYAFGGFTKDNALKPFDKYQDIEKGGYAKFTGLKTYNKNLKTLLAVGGWNEGSSRFSPMVADRERRREFVKNSIKFLRKNHFDGLDLDWEYPAFRDGGKPRDKDNYANLVQELREEFDRESAKTGRPRLLLSLAMPAGIEYIDKGYDVPRLNEYLDFINLLSYDYHSSYEPAVNHHSPLYPLEEDNEYNYDSELTIDYTIDYLLKKGASPEKIILGIPTYGRSYTLFNEDATDLGSPADGPGVEGDATREKGYLAYYEICESLAASEDWEVIQPNPNAMGPYAFKGDQWVGYDDENIVRLKAKYANEKHLGGIMFWTIDNDDFRGKCHDRPYPLIEAAKEVLLTDSTNTVQQSSSFDNRKKTRLSGVQSNTVGRKSSSRRTTTTAAPITRKRVTSPRPKFRTFAQPKASVEEEDDQEVDRRSYNHSSSEEEEADSDGGNAVRSTDKNNRSREKSRPKNRSSSNRNRRKQNRRKGESKNDSEQGSLSNKLTTPEPPTTPDPGTDFKCEDEGFFSHPRDCKKYFWCLDAGPGGLGVVAHQFTCPSGLVFNKAADSCDYPRNVICPKSKTSQSTASTIRAPIIAATSRTTYLYSSTRKPTTEKPESEEEYEEYDDDDDDDDEIDEEEEEEVKEEIKVSTTSKPLLYKTITRNKPTTTTTTTTEAPSSLSKSDRHDLEKVIGGEGEEEDPKVIKELIMLIKKAGGIEELEKQLFLQNKSPDETNSENEPATPATISRTLYERVLSRQAGKSASRQRTSGSKSYANGPGGAQFEGLDEVPEVKTLRRSYKPQYVTIERPKSSTKEPPVEEEELNDEEDLDDDTADVASSEEQSIRNSFLTSSTQRATPNYINIRRGRPSTTTKSRNENDVDEKDEDIEEEVTPVRSRRPSISSKNIESTSSEDTKDQESLPPSNDENSSTTKSRYISIQRFRSTTPRSPDVVSEVTSISQEPITETSVSSETPKAEEKTEAVVTTTPSTTSSTTTPSSIILSTTANDIDRELETEEPISYASSTTESVKLVEDSATEILLTTAPASLSKVSSPSTRISTATVSQPRPFGFNRRTRPTDAVTTPLPASNDQTRSKVANSEPNRLPTLRELIGYQTKDHTSSPSPVHLNLLDKRTNLVLEDDDSPNNPFPSIANVSAPRNFENVRESWTLDKIGQSNETSDAADGRENELDVFDVKAHDYVENNDADDENNGSSSNKKRMDREDSSTTTPRPTTMRGPPLITLLQTQIPRGFYVTRNETERFVTEKTDGLTTESSRLPTESSFLPAASIILPTESSSLPTALTTLPTESSSLPTASTTLSTESSSLSTASTTVPTEVESHDNSVERLTISNTNITTDTVLEQARTKESTRTSTTTVTSTFRNATEVLLTSADMNGRDNEEKDPKPTTQQLRQRGISKYTDSTTASSITDRQVTRVIRNRIGIRRRIRTTTPPTIQEQTDLSTTDATSSTIPAPEEFLSTTLLQLNDYTTGEPSIHDSPTVTTTDSSELLIDVTNSDATKPTSVLSLTTSGYSISSSVVSEKAITATLHKATTTDIAINDTLESVTEPELNTQNPGPSSEKTQEIATATQSVQNRKNSTTSDQDLNTSTLSSTSVDKSTNTPVSRVNRGRQKNKFDLVHEFGRRANRHRGRPSVETQENSSKKVARPQQPRRRVTIYRGRQRRPVNGSATVPRTPNNPRNREKPKVAKAIETKANNSVENPNDEGAPNEGDVDNGKKLVPYAIETNVHGEQLLVEKAIDRAKPEVNSSKPTAMSPRIPGSLPSTRLRRPTAVSLASSQNKSSNALVNNRKNRPTDGNEKLDAATNTTELPKSEKDIDQNSRAQEIAVTLADPPTSQSSSTGRPSLRNALRRRISTTLAPRTDVTTSRTTIGFAPIRRDRQKPKAKDTPQQNVTTRPRRPQVIDYDYYEDEEEPVIAKSTYNGKLALTNKGNIRCLDQGNFPHPYSCKKFITCAKMVNGLVVGAEYTCPDKLSYDPVGGICNWSAGLGCKE